MAGSNPAFATIFTNDNLNKSGKQKMATKEELEAQLLHAKHVIEILTRDRTILETKLKITIDLVDVSLHHLKPSRSEVKELSQFIPDHSKGRE